MKAKFTLFLCLSFVLLLSVMPQYIYGQFPGGQLCPYCSKTFNNCAYKGKHPKCQTCGKVIGAIKDQCPHNGKHLKPQPTTGTLSISSTPSDASVKIDGRYLGTTPLTLDKQKAGTYKVTFSAEGYEIVTKSVTVTAGKSATCSATLKKKQAPQPAAPQPAAPQPAVQQPTKTTTTTPTTTTTAPSQTITVNGVSFKMILVEGGTFTMGATSEQGSNAHDYEKPAHQVTLSSYYIGETEVTQALWEAVMGTTVSQQRDLADKEWPLRGVGFNYPMYYISWNDCKTFISKLNSITDECFRLPTEAEWEFAARGGNKSQGYKYSGGNTLGNVAWYWDNSGDETHDVKTKSPNELGLYDMSGNVLEWCQDWFGKDYYSFSSQTNPTGPSSGSSRVSRGGIFCQDAELCRVSRRDYFSPDKRGSSLGFRLVRELTELEKEIEIKRKKLDEIKKALNDSIKDHTPAFGLG